MTVYGRELRDQCVLYDPTMAAEGGSRIHSMTLGPLEKSFQWHLKLGDHDSAREVPRTLDREQATLDEILCEKVQVSIVNAKPAISAKDVFKGLEPQYSRKVKGARHGASP